jgi:hypothetical protein
MKSKKLTIPINFTGNEHIYNPSFVRLELTKENLLRIKQAKTWLADNQAFDNVSMPIIGELLNSKKKPDADDFGNFRFEKLIISIDSVWYEACHKHDFSATIESEDFEDKL